MAWTKKGKQAEAEWQQIQAYVERQNEWLDRWVAKTSEQARKDEAARKRKAVG